MRTFKAGVSKVYIFFLDTRTVVNRYLVFLLWIFQKGRRLEKEKENYSLPLFTFYIFDHVGVVCVQLFLMWNLTIGIAHFLYGF